MSGSRPPGISVDFLRNAADGVLLDAVISGAAPSFGHCRVLTDGFGMAQFASGREPDMEFGYCVDDNARAFLAAILALQVKEDFGDAQAVGETALRFLEFTQRPDGQFHNLVDANRLFQDDIGSPDSFGRTVWACGVAARCAPSEDWRARSESLLEKSLPNIATLCALRPRAYAVLGLAAVLDPLKASLVSPLAGPLPDHLHDEAQKLLENQAQGLSDEFQQHATSEWPWWEDQLSWGNARLPEALLRAAIVLGDPAIRENGFKALEFLAAVTHPEAMFRPIGNAGWYRKGGERPLYDQQPIEACGMVDMWLAAEQLRGDKHHHQKALEAFSWFLGLNTDNLMMADPKFGGCYDGLMPGAVNQNMGAESTLSYVHAHAALAIAAKKKQP